MQVTSDILILKIIFIVILHGRNHFVFVLVLQIIFVLVRLLVLVLRL